MLNLHTLGNTISQLIHFSLLLLVYKLKQASSELLYSFFISFLYLLEFEKNIAVLIYLVVLIALGPVNYIINFTRLGFD